jgi:hypothetical protein
LASEMAAGARTTSTPDSSRASTVFLRRLLRTTLTSTVQFPFGCSSIA